MGEKSKKKKIGLGHMRLKTLNLVENAIDTTNETQHDEGWMLLKKDIKPMTPEDIMTEEHFQT